LGFLTTGQRNVCRESRLTASGLDTGTVPVNPVGTDHDDLNRRSKELDRFGSPSSTNN
jgi:hypothetical protein